MLLSYAVARRSGADFETLIERRLFAPLGMDHAYVDTPPAGVRAAVGHTPNGQPTPPWRFATDLAGVGGVHATLEDMVRYVQGNLGLVRTPVSPALELAQRRIGGQPPMAMNWMLVPVAGRTVHLHEGGTGGFSSFVSVDRDRQRGVVILSDTAWHSLGGLGHLGMHLVDPSVPPGTPRKPATPPQALLDGLVGEYRLQGVGTISLRRRDGQLVGQAQGQPELELAYDDHGDFYPMALDALLTPRRRADGRYDFVWTQSGSVLTATRIEPGGAAAKVPALSAEALAAYAGDYPLMPDFVLTVRARAGTLYGQATGQGEFPLQATGKDVFEAPALGVEIAFSRGADGGVASLTLRQGGRTLSGKRR